MGSITIESTVLIPCARAEVYAFCVDAEARSAVPGQDDVTLQFGDQVQDRSWTETHEARAETITAGCVVYPVADSTRLTVTAQYVPKGLGRMLSAAKEGAYRKLEAARLAALKKAVERGVRMAKSAQ
jgi:O-acetyl-ADP-ribose deacetylase (regulator of RNase III)